MQYFLRINQSNWCDEFDIFGMKIYNELEHGRLVDALHSIKNVDVYWGFGSNQGTEGTVEELTKNTKVHLIDEDQMDAMKLIFPHICDWGVGMCADASDLLEDYKDGGERGTPAVKEYWRYKNEQYKLNRTKS